MPNPNQVETADEDRSTMDQQDTSFESAETFDHDDGLVHNHDWASTSYAR